MLERASLFMVVATTSAIALYACGGDDTAVPIPPDASAQGDAANGGGDAGGDADASGGGGALKHVFYIMMENHGYDQLVGNAADAPYVTQLASQYGVATNYYGVTHPSLPNYLAAISGDFQGIWDDCKAGATVTCPPEEFITGAGATAAQLLTSAQMASSASQAHWFTGKTVVEQIEAKSLTWKAYMQGIPAAGNTDEYAPVDTVDGGAVARKLYAQKHDPFMYFTGVRGDASRVQRIVPFTQLAADLGSAASTPSFVWISPDQCHDMHGVSPDNAAAVGIADCAYPSSGLDHKVIALGDAFLRDTVGKIMSSPAWSERSVIVVVWDEDDYEGTAGCCGGPTGADGGALGGARVPAIVIPSRNARPQTSSDAYNHYSLLATIQDQWGLGCLANTCGMSGAQLMTKLFVP